MTTKESARPEQNLNTQLHDSSSSNGQPSVEENPRHLKNAIGDIDAMCQIQLTHISALAMAILRAAEVPEFWRQPDVLSDLLSLIKYTAMDLQNYVNGAAEAVGCDHADDTENAQRRRVLDAFRAACKAEIHHG